MSPGEAATAIAMAARTDCVHYSSRDDSATRVDFAGCNDFSSSSARALSIIQEDHPAPSPSDLSNAKSSEIAIMDEATSLFTQWANFCLIWIGFGTLVGLLAKLILPGKDPGATFATLVIGVFGSIVGAALLFFITGLRVSPISPGGFAVALVATIVLLVLYRILYGQKWTTGVTILKWRRTPRRRGATSMLEE